MHRDPVTDSEDFPCGLHRCLGIGYLKRDSSATVQISKAVWSHSRSVIFSVYANTPQGPLVPLLVVTGQAGSTLVIVGNGLDEVSVGSAHPRSLPRGGKGVFGRMRYCR